MVITRLPSVLNTELPAANIYLDDLEEILNILKPDGEDQPPYLKFTVNDDMICDSIDDLRKIGGRTSVFEMEVRWRGAGLGDGLRFSRDFRAHLHAGGGSAQRRTWVITQVADLFRRRIDWRAKFRWLMFSATCFLVLLIFVVGDRFFHRIEGSAVVFGLTGLLSFPVYLVFNTRKRSTVFLQNYSDKKGSWFQRHLDQIILAAVTSVISAIIGAAIATFFHHH